MTRLRVVILVVAAIAVGVFLVTVPTFREFFDLGVYRGAVRSWLLDGHELYDFLYQNTEYGFTYPPFAALVFSPLALTSWPVAVALSIVVNAAALVAPSTSAQFWLTTLWDTDRVGRLEYVSNQSLRGVMARLELPSAWWLAAVALILAIWFLRVRLLRPDFDHAAGFAATGIVACLISPVTWVHHLVWLLPALFLLTDAALQARARPRLALLAVTYVILSSSVVWLWWAGAHGLLAAIGSNTYVWISVALLLTVPFRPSVRTAPLQPAQSDVSGE